MQSRSLASVLLAALVSLAAAAQTPAPKPGTPDANVVKDFQARVRDYLDMRKKQAGTSPAPTTSSAKLVDTQRELAQKIRAARPDAKQGDIFTPEIADYFRRQLAATLAGPQGKRIRTSLRHAEPIKGLKLQVDQAYPPGLPLQSTPPSLLLNLPQLPKELEYRIVDHDLVLHDIAPNLVVDFMPDALPRTQESR
jgi:hypothetical protein